jgi:hypothetical protein
VLHPQQLGEPQERLPEAAVAVDQHARAGVADRLQRLERRLHVGEVGDHVDEEDRVEGPPGSREHLGVGDVALEEPEPPAAVALRRGADGGGRDVDAHPDRGPQGREEVAGAAAEVEHALSLRHAHPEHAGEVVVVVPVPPPRALDRLVVLLVEAADLVQDGVGRPRGERGVAHGAART